MKPVEGEGGVVDEVREIVDGQIEQGRIGHSQDFGFSWKGSHLKVLKRSVTRCNFH